MYDTNKFKKNNWSTIKKKLLTSIMDHSHHEQNTDESAPKQEMNLHHILGHDHTPSPTIVHALDAAGFVAIFSFSFVMSLHCATMCAPLVCAKLKSASALLHPSLWRYNLARIVSYIALGTLFGSGVQALSKLSLDSSSKANAVFPWFSHVLTIAVGGVIISYGIFSLAKNLNMFRFNTIAKKQSGFSAKITQILVKFSNIGPSWIQDILFGAMTAFLPCATLTPALLAAIGTAHSFSAGLYMLAFGLGTLPIMTVAPSLPGWTRQHIPEKLLNILGPTLLILVGVMTLLR